ncbi:hypothetical protein V6N12_026355 [Hibiscus sabdariffa]|uniref:Cellulose synthase-like protein E1 n=1 Tax=Hibiscus sabdariffa TaxID=183260 RepID=A0ABR2DT80_9ROSI
MGKNRHLPLFETRPGRGLVLFRWYAASIFIAICFIFWYRLTYFPAPETTTETWVWVGMFLSELWFTFYFFITVVVRWNLVFRSTFKDRLSARYEEEALPGVDIFVCTADPRLEPPTMVISTVLSVMAYDYPPEKLSVYLSDDGCSDITFYALLEASRFARLWLPFCRKFKVEPASPEAYFQMSAERVVHDSAMPHEWSIIKKSYQDMKSRIETVTRSGKVPADIREEHDGFYEWDLVSGRLDHPTIVQLLIDGRDPNAVDNEGKALPTLVYLAREKRPQFHHHFKAGALNALIRVSSRISNASFILNVDCDVYSNNSKTIRDALCFFLDEENGHDIAYVQYPQTFKIAYADIRIPDILNVSIMINMVANDERIDCVLNASKLELAGFDGNGGTFYAGTGCVHRREALCGMKYSKELKATKSDRKIRETASSIEQDCKALASCTYEENTQWGKQMGVKYESLVEDILTGMSIQNRRWRSVYFNPERTAFLGVVPTTLLDTLLQHKRWAEGQLQILLSKHCTLLYDRQNMPLKLQLSYCNYMLWAPNSFATLYFVIVPAFCLLKGISLFPSSLVEFVWCGGTVRGWLNEQRMWLFKRTTSYLFAFIDHILKLCRFSKPAFVVTRKVADDDVNRRYEQEIMDFGSCSPMFTILATLALFNLFGLVATGDVVLKVSDIFGFQILLCCVLVFINLPTYQAMFFRRDSGKIPASVTLQSLTFALLASALAMY